jgi:hypothetical protein
MKLTVHPSALFIFLSAGFRIDFTGIFGSRNFGCDMYLTMAVKLPSFLSVHVSCINASTNSVPA